MYLYIWGRWGKYFRNVLFERNIKPFSSPMVNGKAGNESGFAVFADTA